MRAKPTTPNVRPGQLPPLGPLSRPVAYGTYAAVAITAASAVPISQRRCAPSSSIYRLSPSFSAKKLSGSTRMAAPCGQAYTQAGSLRSRLRSQVVAFSRTTAFLRPGCISSGTETVDECRLMLPYGQALSKEGADGKRRRPLVALADLGQAGGGLGLHHRPDRREATHHLPEVLGADPHQLDVVERRAGGHAHAVVQQPDLAEIVAPGEILEDDLTTRERLGDFDEADPHQVEIVRRLVLAEDDLAGLEGHQRDALAEVIDEVLAHAREHRHAAQMRGQRAIAVAPIQLGLERAVLPQHVDDVAQHLEDLGVLERADRRRPRIERQARHLAEQLTLPQLGHRVAVRQVDRRVDGNEAMAALVARILVAAHELTEPPEEPGDAGTLGAPAVLDVGQRARDRDLDAAAQDVERRRALLALSADDLAGPEAPADDRAAVEGQERPRGAGEHGQREQLVGTDLGAVVQDDVEGALVGEGAGGAAHHALPAAHAARLAHRHVGVERDARLRALAGPADHEVLLDLAAGADATVAEDARGMVDVDDRRRGVGAAGVRARRESRVAEPGLRRLGLELAIAGGPLARAGRRMVGQEHLVQRPPHLPHALGVGPHLHAVLDGPDAGG